MDCSPPGSSVHEILQARILEWVAMPFSRGSSPPRDQTRSPALQADSLSSEQPGKHPPPKVPNDPAIPLLGIYHEKITIQKDMYTPMFTAALFTIARKWKQPRCLSTDEWIKKLWYFTHTHTMKYSVQFSHSVVSDSLWPHELQHTRPPCPSPTPRVYSNSCPLSQWCYSAIPSSVIPFSSCPQSLPASGSFPMSQLFVWGGQCIGVSASASVLPMNTQD